MAFFGKYGMLVDIDTIDEVRKQEKHLPYSVSPIGDFAALQQWRAEQCIKETAYQRDKEARYQVRKSIVSSAIEAGTIQDKWLGAQVVKLYDTTPIQKPSLMHKLTQKILNLFIRVKFND